MSTEPELLPGLSNVEPNDLRGVESNTFQQIPLDSFRIPNAERDKLKQQLKLQATTEQVQIPGGSALTPGKALLPIPALEEESEAPDSPISQTPAPAPPEQTGSNEISPADVDCLLSPEPGADAPMKIWVKDPEKVEVSNKIGLKTTHYTYLVRTESIVSTLSTTGTEVRRRFSEFDALHKLLKAKYKGYFIPALPEKSFIESKFASENFIKLRTVDLQAFVRGLAAHPVLRETEELRLFLTCVTELQISPQWGSMLQSAKSPGTEKWRVVFGALASDPPSRSASSGSSTFIPSLLVKIKSNLGLLPAKRECTEEEIALRQSREELKELLRTLQVACDQARGMVQHLESLCDVYAELGRTFNAVTRFEEQAATAHGQYTESGQNCTKRAADTQKLSLSNIRHHNLLKHHSVKTAASLVTMHDYCTLLPEAINALEEREMLINSIHVMESDLDTKQTQLADVTNAMQKQVAGNFSTSARRSSSLKTAVSNLEEDIRAAKELYETLTERNKAELKRLNLERTTDFHRMAKAYTNVQATMYQASSTLWTSAAEQFDPAPATTA